MYEQGTLVRDYIFPVIKSHKKDSGGYDFVELIGTGFLIGNNGYALTAGHVIDQLLENIGDTHNTISAIFHEIGVNDMGIPHAFEIEEYEQHPEEDVGIIKLKSDTTKWTSIIKIDNDRKFAACEYHCWGYPHEVSKELKKLDEDAKERPEIIFTQGYVRRRISNELYPTMIFKGTQFYELSETVGGGNSGGPLILKNTIKNNPTQWEVFGIYIGEKHNGNIGYGVRAESFADWSPNILGKKVIEEANEAKDHQSNMKIKAVVSRGHGVASGQNNDPRYPQGTLKVQTEHFQKRGLDLSKYFLGTVNVDIAPYTYEIGEPKYFFEKVDWSDHIPPENFYFFDASLHYNGQRYDGLIYLPDPTTKAEHFQQPSILELLLPKIEGLDYGHQVFIEVDPKQLLIQKP